MQDSKNESPPSTLSTAITIQNQHGDLDDSLERNEDKLNEMCQRLLSLLYKNNMDEALAVSKKMALLDCQSSMSDTSIRLMYKYQQLVDKAEASAASMALLAQSTKKIDFINRLPYDLVVYTVYYLWCTVTSLDHRPPFLYVSKTWRRIILEATPFFSRHATESSAKTLQSRIRRMTIDSRVVSLSSMLGHQLVSVKYLSIGLIYASLSCRISFGSNRPATCFSEVHDYYLDELMDLCPNLESLTGRCCVLHAGDENKQYHQMKILDLRHHCDELYELLQQLPCLVALSIEDCPDVDNVDAIMQLCPSLKCLKYNADRDDMIQWPFEWDTSLGNGIQSLFIDEREDHFHIDEFVNIIVRISTTLKDLHLECFSPEDEDGVSLPQGATFPELKQLSFTSKNDEMLQLILEIISQAPVLEAIQLDDPYALGEIQTSIDIMTSCNHLIRVNMIMYNSEEDQYALRGFLDAHIERGADSSLRSMAIACWSDECIEDILTRLPELTLLEHLHVVVGLALSLDVIIDAVRATNIKQLYITLDDVDVIEGLVFTALKHMKSLRSLVIQVSSLSTSAALSLLDLDQVTHVQIPFNGLCDTMITALQQHFPNTIALEDDDI
ncbi:hypothetical protein LRAMOSA11119 [Lichtheimia ramosa]|uniref:F-box domain-containing protein n=1 Tax=Lichtheimia ramosa TaxID=688394 RepID=A0A077WUD4_9FUNG|nr:hypothetical protein LRAMOSA11119 [Lichtheimia ramosa]